jgi:hypothetical protein
MKSVYLKSISSFLLMFIIILVILLHNEPDIIKIYKKDHIKNRPSDTRIVLYALLYAFIGTFIIYFIEKGKYMMSSP